MSSWSDKQRRHKVRSDAKYDTKTAAIVTRLLAAGFTYEDVGYAIGVRASTIASWYQRYPVFKNQVDKLREVVKSTTLAQMLRCAWGYDYSEYDIKSNVTLDKDGNIITSEDETQTVMTEHKKKQPPDRDLLKFIILNVDKENWKDIKQIDIKATNITPELAGKAEADQIAEIAGALVKTVESKEVDKDRNTGTIPTNNSENSVGESSISDGTPQRISKG